MSRVAIPAALSRGAKGWDAVRLSEAYTQDELSAAIVQINEDPANANPEHAAGRSIYLLTRPHAIAPPRWHGRSSTGSRGRPHERRG